MDFFKPGSVSIKKINADGSLTDVDIDSLPDFLKQLAGDIVNEAHALCDCPPDVCLSDEDDTDDADFDIEFEPDFELSQDEPSQDHIEAVANLGRVLEGLTQLAHMQADLVEDLFGR